MSQEHRPPKRLIVTIVLEDAAATPIGNEPVYREGEIVGKTASAAFGYRVGKPVALAISETAEPTRAAGTSFEVEITGVRYTASLTRDAAFDPEGAVMRLRKGNGL